MHSANSQAIESNSVSKRIFKAVILRQGNSDVLLVDDGYQFELPIVIVPAGKRIAEEVDQFISRLWGLQVVFLFQSEPSSCDSGDTNPFVVLEVRDPSWLPPANFQWISRREIANRLYSVKKARSLQEVMATAEAHKDSSLNGPFARAGWFDDLLWWVQRQLDRYQLQLTGKFRQLNADPSFSLVRLETDGPAIWFKAVGEPNRHEFPITVALTKYFPRYLPALIATKLRWNGWLMFEAEGSMLDEQSGLSQWEKAAETLAELQIESVQHTQALLDASSRDLRISALLEHIDSFFDVIAELMAKQSTATPAPLSFDELRDLRSLLKGVCSYVGELGLPDTIGHLDFNPSNIMVTSDRCVFLDWAEAYVGPPFFTLEYLRKHLSRIHPHDSTWRSSVTSRYLEPWSRVIPADNVSQILEVTPLMAVFGYAVGSDAWRNTDKLQNPSTAGYLRMLTRRMQSQARLTNLGGGDA